MDEAGFQRVGERLAARRRALDMKVEQAAAQAGVGVNTLKNMELGRPSTVRNLTAIAEVLGASMSYLFGEPEAALNEMLPGWSELTAEQQTVLTGFVSAAAGTKRQPVLEGMPAEDREILEGLEKLPPRARQLILRQVRGALRTLVGQESPADVPVEPDELAPRRLVERQP